MIKINLNNFSIANNLPFVLIAGPCVIENEEHTLMMAEEINNICSELKIKLIYFSTSYVYPGTKGNYKEKDSLLPVNNYAWSKLGGECAVQMYKNSLILRICMTEKPFVHSKAFVDFITNFIFHEGIAKYLFKLINKKGIINVGGETQSVYSFAKKYNTKIKKN